MAKKRRKSASSSKTPSLKACLKGIRKAKERATGKKWSDLHGIESRLTHCIMDNE